MNIRIPKKVWSMTTDTKRLVSLTPLALLVLSAGILATHTTSPASEAPEEVEPASHTSWSDSVLHPTSIDKIDLLSQADSTSIMHFLVREALQNPGDTPLIPPNLVDEETLWLARGIYSETKRPEEQELVAWTIRNRVETEYRGRATYRDVVLDPYQFSAFNPDFERRSHYKNLDADYEDRGWQQALSIAYHVRHADPELRPFPKETRHFFSERSMMDRTFPSWAQDLDPIRPERHEIDEQRFRFFAGVF